MKKPTSFCCFTWIAFIALNLTVEFLFIRETWDDRFDGKVGWWKILRNEGGRILVMGRMNYEMEGGVGAWYPFTPLCWHLNKASLFVKYDAENSGLLFLYL